jgi:transposase
MTKKERNRMVVLLAVKKKELKIVQAAELMAVCYRQAKRLAARFQAQGEAGLVHRSRGRPSARRKAASLRQRVLARYQERYEGFGPTLAAEHLEREGLGIDHETLRRWLQQAGLRPARRRGQKHRARRERKECFGEMVQMDGSDHDWLEGRGPRAVLMVMVDDATNHTGALFCPGETTRASFEVLEDWGVKHGLPGSLYVDRDSIYRAEGLPSVAEQLAGQPTPPTQFGRAMEQLGVRLILAHSPQAKGRVERRHGVFQDRLVKEMRLEGIKDLEGPTSIWPSISCRPSTGVSRWHR